MMTRQSQRRAWMAVVVALLTSCAAGTLNASAWAAAEGPGWELTARSSPTNFSPSPASAPRVSGTISIEPFNIGSSAAGCTAADHSREVGEGLKVVQCPEVGIAENPIVVTDVLPSGVRAVDAGELLAASAGGLEPRIGHALWTCSGNASGPAPRIVGATIVTCVNKTGKESEEEPELSLFSGGGGAPTIGSEGIANSQPVIGVAVDVQPGAEEHETNRVSIAGGGAPNAASTSDAVSVSESTPPFGITNWDGWFSNADGTLDTQAGSHPYEATFDFDLATIFDAEKQKATVTGGEIKTAEVELPPGFVGDPTAVPQCPRQQFDAEHCSLDSMIGVTTAYFANLRPLSFQVFNLVPPPGVPAEFGFSIQGLNTYLDAGVRSGSDYGITEHVSDVAQKEVEEAVTTLWGVPGDASHNRWRDGIPGGCAQAELEESNNPCTTGIFGSSKPFLTLPTACGLAAPFVLRATSWTGAVSESRFYSHDASGNAVDPGGSSASGFSGCGELAFAPLFTASPDTARADSPAGLTVDVKPALGGLGQAEGLGSSDIKGTTVVLPPGFVINPGQAAGLQACLPSEDGLERLPDGEEDSGPASCPNASKVGTVRARTPLIEGSAEKELEGSVYVLQSNPPDLKLLAAFSADGVNVKLVLDAHLDEHTGQITTRVVNIPELPVSDFKLSFSGGAQAALDTPAQCGTYQSTADFTPWSTPFVSDFAATASFTLSEGPGGGACPGSPMPFAPSLVAGATSARGGSYTGFSMLLQRGDGQQRIERLSFKAPAGLSGRIAGVPLCGEPQAAAGTCPVSSHIGHAVVAAGPGPYPLVVPQPGEPEAPIYLTGPYEGAPFGLSIVTPVIAGPFNLGTIVTRARIDIDPHTAQITVTTDPLPQIVDGVPTDLRSVDAVIDRAGFMFNPTHCAPGSFSGTATSTQGTTVPIASPFDVVGCKGLGFAPKFSVSTSGRSSRANGASLTARLSYPAAAQGSQSNITRVKVDLPKQLPSRLTTLQKACTSAQFETNPAGCPAASKIGTATVNTPVLPVPLSGPAIFVSHGGEAFPSLTLVLQGDGVTVDIVGTTFISKAGITSSTFKTVPDVPFATFTLTLPQGKYSALAANLPASAKGSLCGQALKMPTELLAQNGAKINQSTPITIAGCAKKKKTLSKAQKLTAALKACHKKRKSKRGTCETQARTHYHTTKKKKK
jgi:hypothetical protein